MNNIVTILFDSESEREVFAKRYSGRQRQCSKTVQPSSLTDSRISASAARVRGVIIHLKGTGCLFESKVNFRVAYLIETYLRQ